MTMFSRALPVLKMCIIYLAIASASQLVVSELSTSTYVPLNKSITKSPSIMCTPRGQRNSQNSYSDHCCLLIWHKNGILAANNTLPK